MTEPESFPVEATPEVAVPDAPAAPPKPLYRRIALRILIFGAVFYGTWCGTLFFYQDKMLFPTDLTPDPLPLLYSARTVELSRDIGDGQHVVAWFVPGPDVTAESPGPLAVFFHGNAELIDHQHTTIDNYLRLGCSVLLPEFRGYGRSGGTPSEAGIVEDAAYFFDLAIERPEVDPRHVVIHGRSLGGGPAAQLAALRPPAALILESTFRSAAAMASKYWAPQFLVKNTFYTDRVLAKLRVPVLIFHGTTDNIIPVEHGRQLHEIAADSKYVEYDCQHNNFPGSDYEDYVAQIRRFLIARQIVADEQP